MISVLSLRNVGAAEDEFFAAGITDEILSRLGEYDRALQQLDLELSVPAVVSIPWLELDPRWQPLHNHPGFAKLVEK